MRLQGVLQEPMFGDNTYRLRLPLPLTYSSYLFQRDGLQIE